MWVIIVVVGLLLIATIVNRMGARDRTPPLVRHEKALAALAELSHQPRPAVPDTPSADLPAGHIRILSEAPPPAPRKRPARRPAAASRRTKTASARARHPSGARARPTPAAESARPTIHIGFDAPDEPAGIDPAVADEHGTDAEPVVMPAFAPTALPAVPLATTHPTTRRHDRRLVTRTAVVAAVIVGGGAVGMALAGGGNAHRKNTSPPRRVSTQVTAPATTAVPVPTTAAPPAQLAAQVTATGDANVSVPGSSFTLAMHATGMCWVQVSAANGQTLFTGTLYPGQDQQLIGTAPLVVRLGNTPGMTLTINGTALDLNGVAKTANVHFLS